MRMLISIAALALAVVAQAETPPAVKAAVEPKSFEVKTFTPKSLELATPNLEIQTKDVGSADLDRRLAGKKAKAAAAANEASVMRAPSMPAIMEADQAANAPATAPAPAPSKGTPRTR